MNYRDIFFRHAIKPIFRNVMCPTLNELSKIGITSTEVPEILRTIDFTTSNIEELTKEFQRLKGDLSLRYRKPNLHYPDAYNISDNSALLLYCMVRLSRPDNVLETGVANGISSYFILNAMNKNCKGMLHSVDIASNVGELLGELERGRWHLTVINKKGATIQFKDVIAALPTIDIFIHDSDHSYKGQTLEYETVYDKISANGILSSDDADFSYAFKDFCQKMHYRPSLLVTSSKIFGLIKKNK